MLEIGGIYGCVCEEEDGGLFIAFTFTFETKLTCLNFQDLVNWNLITLKNTSLVEEFFGQ